MCDTHIPPTSIGNPGQQHTQQAVFDLPLLEKVSDALCRVGTSDMTLMPTTLGGGFSVNAMAQLSTGGPRTSGRWGPECD